MAKRLVAKTGEYTNQQQELKGEYTKVGVMLSSNNGEYMLLDPSVSLAGILAKQNALAMKKGGEIRDSVMISIFEDDNQGQQNNNQGQQNNQGNQQNNQGNQQNNQWGNQNQQAPQQQNNQYQQR